MTKTVKGIILIYSCTLFKAGWLILDSGNGENKGGTWILFSCQLYKEK